MSLATDVLAGDRRAVARLLRCIDDELPAAEEALRTLYPKTGKAQLVGVTGTPGAGKSTLCDRLITAWRRQGKRVGVLAVDPTSPFTGGAILGDRIRMQEHALDQGVFIRSLATRGNLGGLSRTTFDSARALDAFGCDVVLIETVGVGQDEVEIAQLAHTTILVTVPGFGDDVQAIKAGVLEIADLFVVNKADREGSDRSVRDLRMMLELRHSDPLPADGKVRWDPPIVKCVATNGEGVDELVAAVARHWEQLDLTGEKLRREQARARTDFLHRLETRLLQKAVAHLEATEAPLDTLMERVARRELDPYAMVDRATRAVLRPDAS
jgi:LAO/AO transport system kinase